MCFATAFPRRRKSLSDIGHQGTGALGLRSYREESAVHVWQNRMASKDSGARGYSCFQEDLPLQDRLVARLLPCRDLEEQGHADQFGKALGLHLCHNIGSMDLNGANADVQLVSDHLVGFAGNQAIQNLPLSM